MFPQGIHFMRQTDSLSAIIYYLKTGMHFWEPGILNLDSIDGKTASEFPLFYYLIAWIYQFSGDHQSILRIFNTLIVFTGFFGVFTIAKFHLKDLWTSLALTFTLMGSLVIFYYANNFLPDAAALGICLCGISLFHRRLNDPTREKSGYAGMGLMILAALLKVSYFVYPFACILVLLFNGYIHEKHQLRQLYQHHFKQLVAFTIGTIAVICWIFYIRKYNQEHHGYFLVKSRSFLDADSEDRLQVMKHVTGWWAEAYYPGLTKYFLSAAYFLSLIFLKHSNRKMLYLSLGCLAGSVAFFFLFFLQFRDHDYYFLAMVPTITIASIIAFSAIRSHLKTGFLRFILLVLITFTGIKGIQFSGKSLWKRYEDSKHDLYSEVGQKLNGSALILDQAGISRDAKLLIAVDHNINGGLYFTRRFGWPVMDSTEQYVSLIPDRISSGASHIVLLDSSLFRVPGIQQHLGKLVVKENTFSVYTLK
jgi:4-amino-4-deoxy-L-arabinose transferase-like glycosyltransferase